VLTERKEIFAMRTILARHLAAGASVLVLAAGAFAVPASTASAAGRDGVCDSGEVCFYYNSNQQGSVSDFTNSVGNYGNTQPSCYDFKGPGNGKGKCLKNEAASVTNRTDKPVTVYYNSNYQGASQTIPAGASVNLNSTLKNQNASHRIGDGGGGGGGSTPISGQWASPAPSNARITANFPRYSDGTFHSGVDTVGFRMAKSACTGTVKSVKIHPRYGNRNARGVSGSSNFVRVDCGGGVEMGYAHFYARDLPSSIKPGAQVKAGQDLFPIGNQGNSSGTHLHFEVKVNGQYVHPFNFLRSKGVTGLPS